MRNLSDTLARLVAARRAALGGSSAAISRLTEMPTFGSDPGDLRAHIFIPEALRPGAALVVVLHGCTQNAAGYDLGAGWSEMADRHGFALLFPEQQRQNNANLCFNWFNPEDSRRGSGEAVSIRQMIGAIVKAHDLDTSRIFVTGLSAGGAMASVMLATYPELFAGGAIIAGLPFGCASTIPQAFDRMRGHGMPSELELAALVRGASSHAGPWPAISIWHGSADATVNPSNASSIVGQWRALHGVARHPSRTEAVDGYPRRVWCDRSGREVIEEYSITGMGHGTPLDTFGEEGCGRTGAYLLEASISSTRHICRFWGLAGNGHEERRGNDLALPRNVVTGTASAKTSEVSVSGLRGTSAAFHRHHTTRGVGKVIEDALRSAGLMR